MTKEPLLDPSLNLRPVQWTDRDAVAQLIYDVCEADGDVTVAITRKSWKENGKMMASISKPTHSSLKRQRGALLASKNFIMRTSMSSCEQMDMFIQNFNRRGLAPHYFNILKSVPARKWHSPIHS